MILIRFWSRLANGGLVELHRVNSIAIAGQSVRAEVFSFDNEQSMLRLDRREVTLPFSALLVADAAGDPIKAATLWLVSGEGLFPGGALLDPDPAEDTRAQMLVAIERQRAAAMAKADRLAAEVTAALAEQLPTIVIEEPPAGVDNG